MSAATRVTVVTDIPSPYQVELFNAVADHSKYALQVVYCREHDQGRLWSQQAIGHTSCFLEHDTHPQAMDWLDAAQLVVFSGYRLPGIQALMHRRNALGKPWVFWGERPGYRSAGPLGRLLRRWPTRQLRANAVPIWGIGEWAVAGYKAELGGAARLYLNVPYFSNLDRFFAPARSTKTTGSCKFLFSGQLIHRKGVDLLATAFARLQRGSPDCELHLLGEGPLRKALQKKLRDISNRVIFHGHQPWQSLPDYYHQADVLCVPSRHDGWALVVPEGLASGLPVIATDHTGAARQLVSPENGWLIPANDANALYGAMHSAVLCGAEKYRQLSAQARTTAERADLSAGVACFNQAVAQTLDYWRQS